MSSAGSPAERIAWLVCRFDQTTARRTRADYLRLAEEILADLACADPLPLPGPDWLPEEEDLE